MMNDEACWTEADWKLFRKRLPDWQTAYMGRLIKKYVAILGQEAPSSERFWQIEEAINRDKKCIGVMACDLRRSRFLDHMEELILQEVISDSDLEGFSPRLCETIKTHVAMFKGWR